MNRRYTIHILLAGHALGPGTSDDHDCSFVDSWGTTYCKNTEDIYALEVWMDRNQIWHTTLTRPHGTPFTESDADQLFREHLSECANAIAAA